MTPAKLTGQELEMSEKEQAEHSLFVQELLLATIATDKLTLDDHTDKDNPVGSVKPPGGNPGSSQT